MTLNWVDSPDEQIYAMYRSTDGRILSFAGTVAQNVASFAATGLNPSTTYFWQVYAVSEGALSSAFGRQSGYCCAREYHLNGCRWPLECTGHMGGRRSSDEWRQRYDRRRRNRYD